MDERDRKLVVERYAQRLEQYGMDIKTLASGCPERQAVRYDVLCSVGGMQGASVLDVGCGFADFYAYLCSRGIDVRYTGFDINPDFIDMCRDRFPEATFEVADLQQMDLHDAYDFVVSSQTFNNHFEYGDNEETVKDVLRTAYEACTEHGGVAIDMMTDHVDFREPRLYYYSPERMFAYCKTLTKRVVLRHDYPLFEFTLYLYKDFEGWGGEAEES